MNRKTFELNGLSCADCALKIENKIKLLDGVDSAQLSFATQKLNIIYKQDITDESMEDIIRKTVSGVEPGVEIIEQGLPLGSANKSRFTKQFKGNILVLTIGILLFCAGLLTNDYVSLVFLLMSWLIAGQSVLRMAISNIVKGHFFDENLLMTIATIGALVTGQYPEAAAVMLFYKVGMLLEDLAVDHSRKSIARLMNLRPEYASIKTNEGIIKTDPEAVKVGDLLLVKPGERIPVDSVILEGLSLIDTSSLTGESLPQAAGPGQQVLGGTINKQSLLTLQAVNTLKQSAVTRILELVEDASSKKAHMESFISRFAVYYTPIVTIAAVLTAILPPILTGTMDFKTWLYRAMIFLVISCPCALVVSIPLTFFAGIGKASSKGILVKGGNYLEALNKVDTIVFDKTGTLTKGLFSVSDIIAVNCTEAELLEYAAYAEANSTHPIAQSIVKAYDNEIEANLIKSSEEAAGKGVKTIVKNQTVIAGNLEYVKGFGINPNIGSNADQNGTMVYVAVDNSYIGSIKVSDTLKPDAVKAVKSLRESSIRRIIMLTGDAREPAESIADQLQLDEFHYGLLPHQKVEWFEKIKKMSAGGTLFVGDGINDAPVLAEADIGVSMGGIGSDAAIEASDIVLMTDEPSKLNDAFKVAALTRKIAIQNVVFALIVKVLVMFLGASGSASMWEAVFADVGVTLLAVLNTMRIRYSKI